jgi:hypothetical protein
MWGHDTLVSINDCYAKDWGVKYFFYRKLIFLTSDYNYIHSCVRIIIAFIPVFDLCNLRNVNFFCK